MAEAITHKDMELTGLPVLTTLLDVSFYVEANAHGVMIVKGHGAGDSPTLINKIKTGTEVELLARGKTIFAGVITNSRTIEDIKMSAIEVTVKTGTIMLDHELKSRSFQDVSMTYNDVVKEVLKDTAGAGVIFGVDDKPIGKPIIQYRETDWSFIRRLASHFNTSIIPDPIRPEANIWFGLNKNGDDAFFEEAIYKVGVSDRFYTENARSLGRSKFEFKYYEVEDFEYYKIGDKTNFKQVDFQIVKKSMRFAQSEITPKKILRKSELIRQQAKFKRYGITKQQIKFKNSKNDSAQSRFGHAEMLFTYTLGKPTLILTEQKFNDKIIGMALTGEVMETERELINIKLDIDGANGGYEYQYKWKPTTGNLMYLMPKIGTRATLLLPDENEQNAYATNSPITNGNEIHDNLEPLLDHRSGDDDYRHRALSTEHDKHMLLHPDRINFIGTGSETSPLQIHMEDLEMLLFQSHNEIKIIAEDAIEIEAPEIGFSSPTDVNIIRTGQAGLWGPLITPVGTGHTPIQPPEIAISYSTPTYLELHNRFDVEGRRGILRAWEHTYFPPFDDAPDLSGFSLGTSLWRAFVVVAVVAVAVVFAPITATAAALAIVGATIAVGIVVYNDIQNQQNSSWNTFFREGVTGAIAGAILNPFASSLASNTVDFIWTQFDPDHNMTFGDFLFNTALSFGLSAVGGRFSNSRAGQAIGNNRFVRGASNIISTPIRWIENGVNGIRRPISNTLLRNFPNNRLINWYARRLDPVDSISGVVFYELTDLEYKGIIPFKWERNYNSGNSNKLSPMGYGMNGTYLMYIEENLEFNEETEEPFKYHTFVDGTGRNIYFDVMESDEFTIIQEENIKIICNSNSYEIFNYNQGLYYIFEKSEKENIHRLAKIQTLTRDHSITLTYNNNNLSTITDTAGRIFTIATNAEGLITKVSLENKQLLQYDYDEHKDLVKITDVKGDVGEIFYKNHLMTKRVTLVGASFNWEYDGIDHTAKCIHSWGNPEQTKTFNKGTLRQQNRTLLEGWFYYKEDHTIFKNDLNQWEVFYFDEEKKLTKLIELRATDIDPDRPFEIEDSPQTTFTYNLYGQKETETNQDGETTKYTYNDFGQVIEVTQPTGATQKLEYNNLGQLIKSIIPTGAFTTWEYDEKGYLKQLVYPNGVTTNYIHENGLLTTKTENLSEKEKNITLLAYDSHNNIKQITYPNGAREQYKYNFEGSCISHTNPLGAIESMKYDIANRMVEHTAPDGNITKLKYNAYTDIVSFKDNEREITIDYTPFGNIARKTERNQSMEFSYNSQDELIGIVNEADEKYTFIRNHQGKVIEEIGFDNVRKLYNYSKAGKLTGVKRGNTAFWTKLKYNKVGQLARIIYDDETKNDPEEEYFTYNQAGQLLEAKNKDTTLAFEYDILGNITKEVQDNHEIISEYNSPYMFMRTKLKSSLGLDLDFNTTLKETTMTVLSEDKPKWEHKETYNLLGQIENTTITAGSTTITNNWAYDNIGRPTAQKSSINNRENICKKYTWGLGTQIKSILDEIDNINAEYSYGKHGNAEIETFKNARHLFKLDENTVTRYLDETGKAYKVKSKTDRKYHAGGQLNTTKAGFVEYTYNDCGDLIQKYDRREKELWKYEYNINGLMSKVIRPDKKEVTFHYDPLGRRISKRFDGSITKFIWDSDKVIHEWKVEEATESINNDVETALIQKQKEELNLHLSEIQASPMVKKVVKAAMGMIPYRMGESEVKTPENLITWLYDENSFTPRLKMTKDNTHTIITDHLGTPQKMVNQNGEVTWHSITNLWGKSKRISGKQRCPFKFQGQYADAETGLYYNRFRYYMPDEGIYTQRDPIGLDGCNPTVYGYVYNTLTQIDPLGLATRPNNGRYNIFDEFNLDPNNIFSSDSVQFRQANRSFINRMNTDVAFRRDMLGRYPELKEWLEAPGLSRRMSNSPAGLTWHHHEDIGRLTLVDRLDHRDNHALYHPNNGAGGRDIWGGGRSGREGLLDGLTGQYR